MRSLLAVAGAVAMVSAGTAASAAPTPIEVRFNYALGFGSNQCGQLGNGGTTATSWPARVSLPGTVMQVAAGVDISAALLSDGTVWVWGDNSRGALGNGTAGGCALTPQQVPGLPWITQIAVSFDGVGVYALGSDGSVWAWGNGYTTPQQVPSLTGITQLSAGSAYVLALRSDGTVWAWGDNSHGQLGDGSTVAQSTPEQVPGLTGITQVTASISTSYAVRSDGTVLSWGYNLYGQLGNGMHCDCSVSTPQQVPGLTGVTQVAADGDSALALAGPGGDLWGWGFNICGQLGDNSVFFTDYPVPTGTTGLTQVAMGFQFNPLTSSSEYYSGAIRSDGTLLTWGCNSYGELGNGTTGPPVLTPTPVNALNAVSQVAFGSGAWTGYDSAYGLVIDSLASVPDLAGDTQAQATQAIQAAGLVLGTVSTAVDRTCNNLGTVMNQSPAAGTLASYGSPVSITIGKPPPPPLHCA